MAAGLEVLITAIIMILLGLPNTWCGNFKCIFLLPMTWFGYAAITTQFALFISGFILLAVVISFIVGGKIWSATYGGGT